MATTFQEATSNEEDQISPTCSRMFRKRAGTTDDGKDYEHNYIANLVLNLITDDKVENFYLSSNDEDFGAFDDVVVEIKSIDFTETFAIQLKHHDRKKILNTEQLEALKGDFSINKYVKSFQEDIKPSKRPINMVLFTNSTLNIPEKKNQSKFGKMKCCLQNNLIGDSALRECCYKFEAETNSEENEDFFENFYLYTDQPNVSQVKKCAFDIFKKHFSSDGSAFHEYVRFVTEWSMKKGKKFKLCKIWMKSVIALCVFSPFIKPLSFKGRRSVNVKEETLREAVSKFDLTLIGKVNFDKIKSVWSDAVDVFDSIEEANKVNNRYQLGYGKIEKKEHFYNDDAVKLSKLMWLLGKSPLVVEGCTQVYETIKLCQTRNLIILDDQTQSYQKVSSFQKLSDLKEDLQLYEKFLNSFTYSLEGQREAELQHLLEICADIDTSISTDDIVQMLEGPLLIGNQKEILPPSHIERKVTKILIDAQFLKNMNANSVALITGVTDVTSFERNSPESKIKVINDLVEISDAILQYKLCCCMNDVSKEEFGVLCEKHLETRFHQFRYLDNNRLEWIRTENYTTEEGYFKELNKFRLKSEFMEHTIPESLYFYNSQQNINIICADPGMGKSTLMKSLKNNSPSSKWTVVIYARNHASHFRKVGSDAQKFVKYILDTLKKSSNTFQQKVFQTIVEKNQVEIIWDGVDEASDATQRAILTLVRTLSQKGLKQWLTSRNNLKNMLEGTLGTFSRNIKQFDDEEQHEYIKNRLDIPEKESSETFSKIKENIMAFPNYGILGIPLQIYMLTELFSTNKEKYLNLLTGVFTVLDLYEHFVEEKFNVLYRDKKEMNLSNEQNYLTFEDEKNAKIKFYKSVAASSYVCNSFMKKITNKLFGSNQNDPYFLEKIKTTGDDVGILSRVTSKNDVEFAHNSYGEYFAALYLFENNAPKARDKKFISDSRYNNIRFFLDLMLSKNLKCFVAVVYKNPRLLEECTDVDLGKKDAIGRDVLEVACAWNKSYSILEKNLLIDYHNYSYHFAHKNLLKIDNKAAADLNYGHISKFFYKIYDSIDDCFKKLMIFFPYLIPYYEKCGLNVDCLETVLYYAITFDFLMIFECIEKFTPLKNVYSSIRPDTILALAVYSRSRRFLKKLFAENSIYSEWDCVCGNISDEENDEIFSFLLQLQEFRTDIPNSKGLFLTHYACRRNLIKTVRLLILRGAKFHVPNTTGLFPIHCACESGSLDTIKLLIANGAKVDLPDRNSKQPIHYACEGGSLDTVKLLMENGAKVDVPDGNNKLPMHYACTKGLLESDTEHTIRLDTVKLLVADGAKVDVPDGNGKQPIHYACEGGSLDTVKLLIANGAKVDVPDKISKLPIHYACTKGLSKLVDEQSIRLPLIKLLVANGAKVDAPDGNGKLAMHYACEMGSLGIVKLLVAKGAKLDVPDGNGKFPMHYACKEGYFGLVILLVANNAKVDVPDGNGKLPMHYACERGYSEIVKLLVANGAKLNIPDGNGKLPIHYACDSVSLDTVKLLVANDVKIDIPDEEGHLPIHYACKNIRSGYGIASFLKREGVKLDISDRRGRLPIHYACESGSLHTVKFLVANDGKVNVPDEKGVLPIHYACVREKLDIQKFLLDNGANVNAPDGEGRLPIHYARKNKYALTVQFLINNGANENVPDPAAADSSIL